jgi:imidazolonepropionase-like amidohydrolase
MTRTLFTQVNILDGSGRPPFRGSVLVGGARIIRVGAGDERTEAPEADSIDGRGATLMPGLIEAHSHLSFLDLPRSIDLGFVPPEEHMLMTARNARRLLDAGFTSCVSAASAKPRLDLALRDAVDAGDFPGPRTLAASPEMTVTAGLGDVRLRHLFRQNFAEVLDGPLEFRRFSREMVREGVDTLKINISGDAGTSASPSRATVMTEAEVEAVCEVAHAHGKRVAAHVRNGPSVRLALRHGVEILYHANLIDDEACAELEAQKDRIFVAPTLGHTYTTLYEAAAWGITTEMGRRRGLDEELERGIANMRALRQRGVRVLPGGDYGFAWNPNGTNARDLEHFVKLVGFSPMEALVAATRHGGELMRMGDELGQVQPGCIADLLLVEGDPLADVAILQDATRLSAIMKDGVFHKAPVARQAVPRRTA